MSEAIVSSKKRMLRSDIESTNRHMMLWACALIALASIHAETPLFENHVVVGNVMIALGYPFGFLLIMKLVQSLGFITKKRSKRFDFVDDIKNPSLRQEHLDAVTLYNFENEGNWKLSSGIAELILGLLFYAFVILLSFIYQSSIYFYGALALSVCLVASVTLHLIKSSASKKNKSIDSQPQSLHDNDEQAKDTKLTDAYVTWKVNSKTNTELRISRFWITRQLLHGTMWIALILAVPLIGLLISKMFWIGVGVGIGYIFVIEMSAGVVFSEAGARLFGHK
ncbi:MAG: hypothetical protein OXG24_01410 [Gammaproteobacteria bacterium]|nr:hypothetical protein [Gammaproteobacteria bacterium]